MTASIKLHNTLTKAIEKIEPLTSGEISLYCCGPTVYDYQHIGNLRGYVIQDILARTFRLAGYDVRHVMNITDVGHLVSDADEGEDKMLVAARREKKSSLEIAAHYTEIFFKDCSRLNINRPDVVCKATEHINEMIELIQRLEERGMTYVIGGNVYFDISKLPDYGKLAGLDLEKLKAGARIEVDSNKRSPADFVLWFTKSKFDGQELQWDSPWGRGYPGWHIECSAMSMKYFGDEFDIHCGGIDHIPVHHTNEIAQSEGATGKPWVKTWIHHEFLVMGEEKMSKSKGGFVTLSTVIEKGFDPLSYRYFLLGGHYKTQLNFTWEALGNAENGFKKLQSVVLQLKKDSQADSSIQPNAVFRKQFEEAMYNDLNTPRALATLWSMLGDTNLSSEEKLSTVLFFDSFLALGMDSWKEEEIEVSAELQTLLDERAKARAAKNWGESDRLRDEIAALGFVVKDSSDGQKLKKG